MNVLHKQQFDTVFPSGRAAGIFGRLFDKWRQVRSVRNGRLAAERLLHLDDRMLDDIGLTRCDVEEALSRPDQDPTVTLGQMRQRRITAERQ